MIPRALMTCIPGGNHHLLLFLFAALTAVATAQNRRTVTQPGIPGPCVQLSARLRATAHRLSAEDESKLDTARIQAALDTCRPGAAVELRPMNGNNAFLTGPLELRSGVTLLIDEGVTLFGSRDAKLYDMVARAGEPAMTPGLCGTIAAAPPAVFPAPPRAATARGGCRPLIAATDVHDAAVMGYGVIDGRGYATLLGRDYSWWQMARKAEPKNERYYSTRLIVANHADGLILYNINLHNSPNFHVSVNGTTGFTAWNVHLRTPTEPPSPADNDARNTDGIDPGSSSDITIAHSWIDNGDDNIALKSGATHISILDNHFYTGHGMSIGSETIGQAYLLVDGLTEDHTSSGIRIKSNVTRGGLIHDLSYKNICMRDVPNPIAISPYYTNQTTEPFSDPGYTGDKIPEYKSIRLENIHATTPGNVLIAGLDAAHVTEILLDNVTIEGITPQQVHMNFVHVDLGGGGANFTPIGNQVTVNPLQGASSAPDASACSGKFVPMQ